jgi:hypothetical protein
MIKNNHHKKGPLMNKFLFSLMLGIAMLTTCNNSTVLGMQHAHEEDEKSIVEKVQEYLRWAKDNPIFDCDGNPETCTGSGLACGLLHSSEKVIRFAGSHHVVSGSICTCALVYQYMKYYGLDIYALQEFIADNTEI